MPIVRSFMCEDCAHMMEVTLTMEQCDDGPPQCPMCADRLMRQQFKPFAIGGSTPARARAIVEDIAANDYHVADMQPEHRYEGAPKVRYKDQSASVASSAWGGASSAALEAAVAAGRETRLNFGSGLDVLQQNIKSGAEPDLLAISKRRAMKVW